MSLSVEFNPALGTTFTEVSVVNPLNMSGQELVEACSDIIVNANCMPSNFIKLSEASKAFREALTAQILIDVTKSNEEQAINNVLYIFSQWLSMTPPGVSTLKTLQEYGVAISFAFERKDLAVQIIKRGQPGETTPAVWTIIDAMKKGMPGILYQNLLLNNRFSALNLLDEQKRLGHLNPYLQ